jgi:predicted alpha-1,6-mannanase (GH76 family)
LQVGKLDIYTFNFRLMLAEPLSIVMPICTCCDMTGILKIVQAALLASGLLPLVQATSRSEYIEHAVGAANILNNIWYNSSNGQWQDLWWNSANIVTMLANLADLDRDSLLPVANYYFENTFATAAAWNNGSFTNDFYDDEGWWAMAWIRVFDLTGNATYLGASQDIFEDMQNGEGATCGGHWWSTNRTENESIANTLYLAVSASLANRVPDQQRMYEDITTSQYSWFIGSGLMSSDNTINDGLNLTNCKPGDIVWTYNQGAMIGALIEMNRLAQNESYLDTADRIAHGAMDHLTIDGILTEHGYPKPLDNVSAQFKGVFVRNLAYLHSMAPDAEYMSFLQTNADAIWQNARGYDGQIGGNWQGPFDDYVSATSQSSALDCLVAAAAVSS